MTVVRVGFEDFEIMRPGFGGIVELLSVEVAEGEVGPGFVGMLCEDLLELVDGIRKIMRLFKCQRETVAGIG